MKEVITKVINEILGKRGIEVKKIILFGSRARGDFNKDSDWDLMVLIDRDLSFLEKRKFIAEMQRKFAEHKIPNNIILKSENQFDAMKNYVGSISYIASKTTRQGCFRTLPC
jgi:predicted nucleotidyltransferase